MSEKENDPPVPTPDEISQKLSDFLKENFGGAVDFTAMPGAPEVHDNHTEESEEEAGLDALDFNYRPRDIKDHLDRFVIRQDEAKKALSIAVCVIIIITRNIYAGCVRLIRSKPLVSSLPSKM